MNLSAPSPPNPSDGELIQAVTQGDEQALAALYDRYAGLLYACALRLSGDRHLAEEAVQNAFLSVWQSAATFDPQRSSLSTWLVAVTKNRTRDLMRARGRDLPVAPLDSMLFADEGAPPGAGDVDARITADTVRRALRALPKEQREVIQLTYFFGYTHKEAAERLAIPLGTVKSRLRLALERLTHLLKG